MTPFIYDPVWTRLQLWQAAMIYSHQVCEAWNIPQPKIVPEPPPHARKFSTGGTHYGLWIAPNRIWVNVKDSTTPARVRGRVWSYPGHKTDRTCFGILMHELAHHVCGHKKLAANEWRALVTQTRPVTSYEPNPNEAWAETVRIYISNPNLLRLARPRRFEYVAQYLPLLHVASWKDVLRKAPDFIIESASKFCVEKETLRVKQLPQRSLL